MELSETRYARAQDGTRLAYKVLGDGPVDLVYLQPWYSHVEIIWEEPRHERFLRRFASFSRLIILTGVVAACQIRCRWNARRTWRRGWTTPAR